MVLLSRLCEDEAPSRTQQASAVVVVVIVVVVVVLTLTRIVKSVVTGQAPVTPELRNTPGKKHTQPKVVLCYSRCVW